MTIKDELPLTVYGDGMQTRDFVYVKDVANACLKAIKASGSHILNVSSNSKLSLNELAQLLIEQSGSSIVTSYEPRKPGDILHSRLKNSLAKHILNWKPRYTIEAGLTEIFSNILTSSKKTEST